MINTPIQPVVPLPPVPPVGEKTIKEKLVALSEKFKTLSKNMKFLVIAGGVLVVLLILLTIVSLARGGRKQQVVKATPTPVAVASSPIPKYEIVNPSKYATDSGVLKIEGDVDSLNSEMNSVDLRSSDLRIPDLDMSIKF